MDPRSEPKRSSFRDPGTDGDLHVSQSALDADDDGSCSAAHDDGHADSLCQHVLRGASGSQPLLVCVECLYACAATRDSPDHQGSRGGQWEGAASAMKDQIFTG